MKKIILLSIMCLILFAINVNAKSPFVEVTGTEFYINDKPFYFSGANNYYLRYADVDCVAYDKNGGCSREVLDDAQKMNFSVIRTWGFTDGDYYWGSMQPSIGIYDEANFKKLDFVIKEASERNLKVIIPFVNNWPEYGGMCQYVKWCNVTNASMCDPYAKSGPAAAAHDSFYTNSCARQAYKDYISYTLNRVNNYTGIKYKDDPTIFAWELANEPRAMSDPASDMLDNWIEEMSNFVKSIDSNHLVTTGEEGFYRGKGSGELYNGSNGNDFISNHNHSNIDFATFHLYPDYWGLDLAKSVDWIAEHADDAHNVLGKPVIIEEFGKQGVQRDSYMQAWYDALETNGVNGNLFWELVDHNYPWDPDFGINYPENTSTVGIISNNTDYWIGFNKQNSASNNPPQLNPINDITITEGEGIAIDFAATDADGDYISYSISDAYHFNRINSSRFVWNTHAGDRGNYTITVTASDGIDEDRSTFNLNVLEKNECVVPFDSMIATINTTLCKGSYYLPNGIQVGANVNLDCDTAEIHGTYGDKKHFGITISGDNTVIKNCRIRNYDMGIQLIGASDVSIISNVFSSYLFHGINIRESDNVQAIGNNFSGNYDIGTYCYHSEANVINNNRFTYNGKGIYFDGCSETEIHGNYFYRNYGGAVHLLGASGNNTCSENNILENGIEWRQGGGFVIDGKGNTIAENEISNNYNGIIMYDGLNNVRLNNIEQSVNYDFINNLHAPLENNSVRNNWFGTTDCNEIKDKVYDCEDFSGYYCLNFEPILDAPYPEGRAKFCNVACFEDSDCGDDGWASRFCKEGDVWGVYRIYSCENGGTSSSYCEHDDTDKRKRECAYGCTQGVCTSNKFTCSLDEDCGTDGLIGSKFCSSGDVFQKNREWTCHNPATVNSYCSYADNNAVIEDCSGGCVSGKCIASSCSSDTDCGTDSWIGIPYCNVNDVWQKLREWSCNAGSCEYSDNGALKEGCISCSNGVCDESNETADLEIKYFVLQSPANPTAGNELVLAFYLQDTGETAVEDVEWAIELGNGETITGVVSEILAGDGKIVARKATYLLAGSYGLKVIVDPDNRIEESNEGNNEENLDLVIG